MKHEDYQQKLLDPRWQKKRLQVLERDHFTCQCCGAKHKTLHVHHYCYTTPNPWDEPEDNLVTLCDECHSTIHNYRHGYLMRKGEGGRRWIELGRWEWKERDLARIWRWANRERSTIDKIVSEVYEERWSETPQETVRKLHGASIYLMLEEIPTKEFPEGVSRMLKILNLSREQMLEFIDETAIIPWRD